MGKKLDVDRKLNKLFSENNFGFAKDESIVLGKNSEKRRISEPEASTDEEVTNELPRPVFYPANSSSSVSRQTVDLMSPPRTPLTAEKNEELKITDIFKTTRFSGECEY
jgi:hypothetical protein